MMWRLTSRRESFRWLVRVGGMAAILGSSRGGILARTMCRVRLAVCISWGLVISSALLPNVWITGIRATIM
jgi:hypothetical protein